MSLYNPIQVVKNIQSPILFVAASHDQLCPIEYVEEAVHMAKTAALFTLNGSHFDIYSGLNAKTAINEMIQFLNTVSQS